MGGGALVPRPLRCHVAAPSSRGRGRRGGGGMEEEGGYGQCGAGGAGDSDWRPRAASGKRCLRCAGASLAAPGTQPPAAGARRRGGSPVGRECLGRAGPRCQPAAGGSGPRWRSEAAGPAPAGGRAAAGRAGPRPSRHRGGGAVEEAPGGNRHPVVTAGAGSGACGVSCRAPLHHPAVPGAAGLSPSRAARVLRLLLCRCCRGWDLLPAGPALPAHLPLLRGSHFVFSCCLRALPEIGLCRFTELLRVC